MDDEIEAIRRKLFVEYAGRDSIRWKLVYGCTVRHVTYGDGVIDHIDIDPNGSTYMCVAFGREREKDIERNFLAGTYADQVFFPEAELPTDAPDFEAFCLHVEAERLEAEKERIRREKLKLREDRFASLKAKYGVEKRQDLSLNSPLAPILEALESQEPVGDEQISWLKENKLYAVVAHVYAQRYQLLEDLWDLAKASSNWRKAHFPETALQLTEDVTSGPANALAAVWTTRGGALRDTKDLDCAEACALTAIELRETYYPYNLLGSIKYQQGDPAAGDQYFQRADELGSPPRTQDAEIRSAIDNATPDVQRDVARHVLERDPERFAWARRYVD